MKSFVKFIEAVPVLCGAKNAARWGRLNVLQFHDELKSDSVFSRNEDDEFNPDNRLDTAFGFEGDENKKAYCRKLVLLKVLNHYIEEHGLDYHAEKETLIDDLEYSAGIYPEIEAAFTVQDAMLSGWEP